MLLPAVGLCAAVAARGRAESERGLLMLSLPGDAAAASVRAVGGEACAAVTTTSGQRERDRSVQHSKVFGSVCTMRVG